jgi:hypothetical protein
MIIKSGYSEQYKQKILAYFDQFVKKIKIELEF